MIIFKKKGVDENLINYLLSEVEDALAEFSVYDTYDMKEEGRTKNHIRINNAYRKLDKLGYRIKVSIEKR